ncbi:hypothetical protein EYF80_041882 [Liparis tanakae]|uniref:Uncharacterized protein n=1 Tax=Liparis tanakae TaxID=230148 RepID=A0A4Z2G346_9TELE|nr:hypothetical protein EYF80_041882 [Liparis tanakae]
MRKQKETIGPMREVKQDKCPPGLKRARPRHLHLQPPPSSIFNFRPRRCKLGRPGRVNAASVPGPEATRGELMVSSTLHDAVRRCDARLWSRDEG